MARPLTDVLRCDLPIQLAPMGCVSVGAALPLAVARAGGHAVYPALFLPPAALEPVLDELASSTQAFGVNFGAVEPTQRCDRGDAVLRRPVGRGGARDPAGRGDRGGPGVGRPVTLAWHHVGR
jgi:NAD(P)H-dependent flavin oxidoreductase YrpB (nitropropane dioxygenase family)